MERKCVVAEHRQGVARNKRGLIDLVIRLRVSRNDLFSNAGRQVKWTTRSKTD